MHQGIPPTGKVDVLLDLINTYMPPTVEPKIVADIGCGDCFFAKHLLKARQDIEIIVIDPAYSPEDIVHKNKEINDQRFHLYNSLDELPSSLKEKKVHFVLFLDMVEHVEKDSIFLQQTVQSLNGADLKILIGVPAFQSG
jgi:2-polyprenyl-3-methyl-5-hydroxy-6-metoxy-1,4-benzoquinol methylase